MNKAETVFENELNYIEDQTIKDFVIKVFDKLTPGYFWTVPCSTSGKYHPRVSLGVSGLVRHIKLAIWWGVELMKCWPGLRETAIDEIVAALLLHDLKKNGEKLDSKGFPTLEDASAVHGPYLGKQIREMFVEDVKNERINRIVCAIEGHMGVWTSSLYENMKPENQTMDSNLYDVCILTHLADYCASRKVDEVIKSISILGEKVKTDKIEQNHYCKNCRWYESKKVVGEVNKSYCLNGGLFSFFDSCSFNPPEDFSCILWKRK